MGTTLRTASSPANATNENRPATRRSPKGTPHSCATSVAVAWRRSATRGVMPQGAVSSQALSSAVTPWRERRLGLVKVTEGLDPWIGLAHALLAEERRLAAVTGASGDLGRGPSRARWHGRQSGLKSHAMLDRSREASRGVLMEGPMPSGRGDAKDKNKKKKSKEQLERELKKKGVAQPVQPRTFEIVKPKRKEKENW